MLHFTRLLAGYLGLLTLLGLSAAGYGWAGLRLVGWMPRSKVEAGILAPALGLILLSNGVFLLGICRSLNPPAAWGLLIGGLALLAALGARAGGQIVARLRCSLSRSIELWMVASGLWMLVGLAYVLFTNGLLPASAYDELAYHLAIPKLYIQAGRIFYIPYILQSNWPLGTEMLFSLGLLLRSEILANLITWGCLGLFLAALVYWGSRWFGPPAGWAAGAILVATPMTLTLSGVALVEIPLGLFSFLAAALLIDWLDEPDQNGRQLVLAGLTAGFAAAIKLNAVQVPLILGGLIWLDTLLRRTRSPRAAFQAFIRYGASALAVALPWYLKAWLQTGNPVWPFLYDLLGGKNWDAPAGRYLMDYLQVTNMHPSLWNWLTGLAQVSWDEGKFGSFQLGPVYLLLLPLGLCALAWLRPADQRRQAGRLALLTLAFYTGWFFQTHQTRFLLPSLGGFALLDAAGLAWLWQRTGKRFTWLTQLALLIGLVVFSRIASPVGRARLTAARPYLAGQISRDQYLAQRIPGYSVYPYANQNLPPDAYVLLAVWESRGFLLERAYHWANPISQREFRLNEFSNPDELAAALRASGYTHIIFNSSNLFRFPYPDNQKNADLMAGLFQNHARLLYQSEPMAVYKLLAH